MKTLSILFLFILFTYPVHSQWNRNDSLALSRATQAAKQQYNQAISGNSQVFNGVEYISPMKQKKVIGDSYYLDYDWQDGNVDYGNQHYEHLSLRYDLFEDKLLIEYFRGYESIELISERITQFEINDHPFVRLSPSADQKLITAGFYDLLYNGHIKVYAKRTKVVKEMKDQQVMVVEYLEKTKFLLFKDDQYFIINKTKDVLNALAERKSELKKFLSGQNKFKTDPEATLIAIATYYDQLK